ncbi:hypothetical protein K449DRAFT_427834 [Hypoxylon sp. EC38]|nr:hypothetical protein K449DRAFT_427834 [Hypoxylon sp. EC38]
MAYPDHASVKEMEDIIRRLEAETQELKEELRAEKAKVTAAMVSEKKAQKEIEDLQSNIAMEENKNVSLEKRLNKLVLCSRKKGRQAAQVAERLREYIRELKRQLSEVSHECEKQDERVEWTEGMLDAMMGEYLDTWNELEPSIQERESLVKENDDHHSQVNHYEGFEEGPEKKYKTTEENMEGDYGSLDVEMLGEHKATE